MCRNRVIFENIVLLFDHNDYVLSRRDSLIVNCQLLIVNYKHQFIAVLGFGISNRDCERPGVPGGFTVPFMRNQNQNTRLAATTRRPLSPRVYSQVDSRISLSPYTGVMPVS